jgi:hypothetical protein
MAVDFAELVGSVRAFCRRLIMAFGDPFGGEWRVERRRTPRVANIGDVRNAMAVGLVKYEQALLEIGRERRPADDRFYFGIAAHSPGCPCGADHARQAREATTTARSAIVAPPVQL